MTDYLGSAVLEVGANLAPLRAGLAEAERLSATSLRRMQSEQAARATALGANMSRIGSTMTRTMTLPILGVAGAATKMYVNFDRAMEMIHTQAGASQQEVDKLKQKVLELGKSVPFGPQALADGLYHIESVGVRLQKTMQATGGHSRKLADAMGMLKAAADGAAVGHANLEQTATALGSAWLTGIKGAGDFNQTMAILNATVGAGNMRMQDLVSALGTGLLPMAKNAHLSLRDVMGALAIFTDEGYNASSAATQMGTALHYLTDPTVKATKALNTIGIAHSKLASDMRKPQGLMTALSDLQSHLDKAFPTHPMSKDETNKAVEALRKQLQGAGVDGKELNKQLDMYRKRIESKGSMAVQQEQILGDIFPAGRGRVMMVLLNQLDRYQQKMDQIHHTQSQFKEDVAATMEQPAVRVQQAWASLQSSLTKFGEEVGPPLINFGTKVVGLVTNAVDAFNRLPPGLRKTIETGGLILAGVGPAMRILGAFTSGIGKLWNITQISQRLAKEGGGISKGGLAATSMVVDTMSVTEMTVDMLVAKNGGGMGPNMPPSPGGPRSSGPMGGGPFQPLPGMSRADQISVAANARQGQFSRIGSQSLVIPQGRVVGVTRSADAAAQRAAMDTVTRYGNLRGSARVMATQGGYVYEDASGGGPYDAIRGGRRVRIVPRYSEGQMSPSYARTLATARTAPETLPSRAAAYQELMSTGVLGVGADAQQISRLERALGPVGRGLLRGRAALGATKNVGRMAVGAGGRLLGGLGTGAMIWGLGQTASQVSGNAAIGRVSNFAAGGAALGSLVGPEGMIVGALGGALVGGIRELFRKPSLEQQIAKELGGSPVFQGRGGTNALQRQAQQGATQRRQQAAHDLARAEQLAAQDSGRTSGPWNSAHWQAANPRRPGEDATQYAARQDAARVNAQTGKKGPATRLGMDAGQWQALAGTRLGQALTGEMGSFQHIDVQGVVGQFVKQFKDPRISDTARQAGAQSVIAWAQSMEKNGKLPAHAAQQIFNLIQDQFPGVTAKFQGLGINSVKGLAAALSHQDAVKASTDMIGQISSEWLGMPPLLKNTGANMVKNMTTELGYLHDEAQSSTGKTRKDALHEIDLLRSGAAKSFKTMGDQTDQSFSDMSSGIRAHTKSAVDHATANFNGLVANIGDAVSSGVLTTNRGAGLIADAINSILKSLGAPTIPKAALKSLDTAQLSSLGKGLISGDIPVAPSGGAIQSKHEQGGMVQFGLPGQKGRDNIVANFGGEPIVVGAGEVGAVFTGEQQAIADHFLAPVGGLGGLFASHSTPHWAGAYDRGGVVRRFQGGGVVTPGSFARSLLGTLGLPTTKSNLKAIVGWENAEGGNWHNSAHFNPLNTTLPEPGAGNTGSQGNIKVYTSWAQGLKATADTLRHYPGILAALRRGNDPMAVAAAIGASPWGTSPSLVRSAIAAASGVGAGAGIASGVPEIHSPKVDGTGTMAHLARLGLHKATSAANKYLQKISDRSGSTGATGAAGAGPVGPSAGPKGLATWHGVTMAKWIADELQWGWAHGWRGQPTSGYRPGFDPHTASGASEHQGTQYPHGAVDFGGFTDPRAAATKMSLLDLANRLGYRGPRLRAPVGFHDDGHLSGTGHARGGFVRGFQRGGFSTRKPPKSHKLTSPSTSAAAKSKKATVAKVKKIKAAKPGRMPGLRAPKDFSSADLQTLQNIQTAIGELGGWQSFIQSYHGQVSVTPTIDQVDDQGNSTTVINWGDEHGALGALTGYSDPNTGQSTKGIWDRVREIGQTTDTATPGQTSDTELGLAQAILNQLFSERSTAMRVGAQFGPWLGFEQEHYRSDEAADEFLTKGLDTTTPFGALTRKPFFLGLHTAFHGKKRVEQDFSRIVRKKVHDYKNMIAQIRRTRLKAGFLPELRRHAHEAIMARFKARRQAITALKPDSTVTSSSLLANSLADLSGAERAARRRIPTTAPSGWQGDASSWRDQRGTELDEITSEFTARRVELSRAHAAQNLAARIKRQQALDALGKDESAEVSKAEDVFDTRGRLSREKIATLSQRRDTDSNDLRSWLKVVKTREDSEKTSIAQALAPDGIQQQIKAYFDPAGQLGVDIATKQNIDIPSLTREAEALKGTKLPKAAPTSTASSGQLNSLLQQQLAMAGEQLAVSQAQYKVLSNLPPFAGSFGAGGYVPGPSGAARTIIAHGGELVVPENRQGGVVTVIVQDGAVDPNKIQVIAEGVVQKATRSAARMGARRLPSAGGGL